MTAQGKYQRRIAPPGNRRLSARELAIPAVASLVWICFAAVTPQFVGPRNVSMLLVEFSVTATLALGMLLVILPAQIDLSAGSGVGMMGGLAAVMIYRVQCPAVAAMLACIVIASVVWWLMGKMIVRWNIQSFVVTLGGLLVFKGVFWSLIQGTSTPVQNPSGGPNLLTLLTDSYLSPAAGLAIIPMTAVALFVVLRHRRRQSTKMGLEADSAETAGLKWLACCQVVALVVLTCNRFRGIPMSFLLLSVIAVAVAWLTRNTPFGRYLYAIGDNEDAARACGVPVDSVVPWAFATLGGLAAVTGFFQASYAGAATPTLGELMELDAIAACVIGGASLRGGRGTVLGALFGAFLMTSLLNGMTLLAVSPEAKLIVRGVVLVAAVTLDRLVNRR